MYLLASTNYSTYTSKIKRFVCFLISCCSFVHSSYAQYDYIENPYMYEEGREAARASFFPYSTTKQALKGHFIEADNLLMLNGPWAFKWSAYPALRPRSFFQNDFDMSRWDTILVPGNWQTYGYDHPIYLNWKYPFRPHKPKIPKRDNPVGSYKKTFQLDSDWIENKQVFLHFDGVNSAFFTWVNGHYVGYAEDSKLPSEFDITPYIKDGLNTLSVEVYRYSDASYLEDQDFWRVSGIERDVYIYTRPKQYIADIKVNATLDSTYENGLFDLDVLLKNKEKIDCSNFLLDISLLDKTAQRIYSQKRKIQLDTTQNILAKVQIQEVKTWTADNPYLYTLLLRVIDEQGETKEVVNQQIGFRKVEIKHSQLLINGQAIYIKGINRHEHDSRYIHAVGYNASSAFSIEEMKEDLKRIKSLNFNAIRTAHYPNHPAFYDLCDKIGLYVLDEANIEAHWYMMIPPWQKIGNDKRYKDALLSRIRNMYERDKNHPSVIIWSIGNENGTGKTFLEAYKMLHSLDGTRPVFNERHFFLTHIKEKHSDLYGNMYAPIDKVKQIISKDDRPFIWIEYAHAMGNSTGNFKDLWTFIRSQKQVQGGFLWDWRDQGIWKKDTSLQTYFLGYGGDFESKNQQHDKNFCANGLLSADGKLHPGAYEVKHVQQPIQSTFSNADSMYIFNEYETRNLTDFSLKYQYYSNHQLIDSGTIDNLPDISPYRGEYVPLRELDLPKIDSAEYLNVFFFDKKNKQIVARSQYVKDNWFKKDTLHSTDAYLGVVSIHEKNKYIEILNKKIELRINKKTGQIENYMYKQKPFIIQGLGANFWRAPTDNDYGNKMPLKLHVWKKATVHPILRKIQIDTLKNKLRIRTTYRIPFKGSYSITYNVYASGEMHVRMNTNMRTNQRAEIPRIGISFSIPKSFDLLTYLGKGPFENYIDRNQAAFIGKYTYQISKQHQPYIRPQEYGNRTNCRWLKFGDTLENGLYIGAKNSLFDFSAWRHTQKDIDEGFKKKGLHPYQVPKRDEIYVNISFKQRGVGGDNSWGRKPYERYRIILKDYSFDFKLRPYFFQ